MLTSTHLIQKALVVIAFLAVMTAKAEAQTRYKTPLGWKHAAITSVIQHADSIYVSLVGGSVAVFTAEQSFVRYAVELDRYYVEELYEVDGLLVAIGRGDIVAMDDNRAWRSVGRTTARVFVDLDGRILFLEQQRIMQLKRQGSQLVALQVGMCPTPFSDIETFAVVGDTVLVGYAGISRIDFGLLNDDSIGSVQLMFQTEPTQFFVCPGSNLYVLASGILFSLRRHSDSVFVPDIVEYDHRYTAFRNAVHARMNDSNRIVGSTILGYFQMLWMRTPVVG